MRVYREFDFYDLYDLLMDAKSSNQLMHEPTQEMCKVIYEYMEDIYCETDETANTSETEIFDFIRFEMQVMTVQEVLNDYNIIDEEELEELDDEEKFELVSDYINDHAYLLGNYKNENNETTLIFTDF